MIGNKAKKHIYTIRPDTNDLIKFGYCFQLLVKHGEDLTNKEYAKVEEEFLRLLFENTLTSKEKYEKSLTIAGRKLKEQQNVTKS